MPTDFTMTAQKSPQEIAATQGIRSRMGAAPDQMQGGTVSQLVTQLIQAIVEEGPTPEVIAAIRQFAAFLKQLGGEPAPAAQAPGQPMMAQGPTMGPPPAMAPGQPVA